jgi:hypothetical protein
MAAAFGALLLGAGLIGPVGVPATSSGVAAADSAASIVKNLGVGTASLLWSPTGSLLAYMVDTSASTGSNYDNAVHIFDTSTNTDRVILDHYHCYIQNGNIRWSASGNALLMTDRIPIPDSGAATRYSLFDVGSGTTNTVDTDAQYDSGSSSLDCNSQLPNLSADGQYMLIYGHSASVTGPDWNGGYSHYSVNTTSGATASLDSETQALWELAFAPTGHKFVAEIAHSPTQYQHDPTGYVLGDAALGTVTPIIDGIRPSNTSGSYFSKDGTQLWLTWGLSFNSHESAGIYDTTLNSLASVPATGPHDYWLEGWNNATIPATAVVVDNANTWFSWEATEPQIVPLSNSIYTTYLSPSGRTLFQNLMTSWVLTDTASGTSRTVPLPSNSGSDRPVWSRDDSYLIQRLYTTNAHSRSYLYDMESGQLSALSWPNDDYYYYFAEAVSPDDRFVSVVRSTISNVETGDIYFYDRQNGSLIPTGVFGSMGVAAWAGSPWSATTNVLLVSTQTGQLLITPGGEPPPAYQLSLSAQPSATKVGDHVTLSAELKNSSGNPVPDKLVHFGVSSGPDVLRFAAIARTDSSGTAPAVLRGTATGSDVVQVWADVNEDHELNAGEPSATTTVVWTAKPVTVFFIQGIGSSSDCGYGFVDRVAWLRGATKKYLPAGSTFHYYAYRSPHTAKPNCGVPSSPQYNRLDSCWSADDFQGSTVNRVPGGGEATRLANVLRRYMDDHPTETVVLFTHSQGGVLASYVVKVKLTSEYANRIRSIVAFDSPMRGINSAAASLLRRSAHCSANDPSLDSSTDMLPSSEVIKTVNDAFDPDTKLYTIERSLDT